MISFVVTLTGCTSISIQSYSDELVSSLWCAKLENSTQIMLSFKDDKTKTPYAFEYIVHFDRVDVKFSTNTVSLYKT